MPSQWNHEADKALLLTIIDVGSLKSIDWPTISNKMVARGFTFTKEACRQHFQKIRRQANEASSGSGDDSPKPTPTKRKANGSTGKAPPGKGGNYANGSFNSGNGFDEDDDEEMASPSKRKKTMKKEKLEDQENGGRTAPLFKTENWSGNDIAIDLEQDDIYEYP